MEPDTSDPLRLIEKKPNGLLSSLSSPPSALVSFCKCRFNRILRIFRTNFHLRYRAHIEPGCFLRRKFWVGPFNGFSHTKSLTSFFLALHRKSWELRTGHGSGANFIKCMFLSGESSSPALCSQD